MNLFNLNYLKFFTGLLILTGLFSFALFQQNGGTIELLPGRWSMQAMGVFENAIAQGDSALQNPEMGANDRKALAWDMAHLKEKYKVVLDSSFIEFSRNDSFTMFIVPDSYHPLEVHKGKWALDKNNTNQINLWMKEYTLSLLIDSVDSATLHVLTDAKDPHKYWSLVKR